MTKLPNAERAIVPLEKFTEYALNPAHPSGRHKARVFQAALGLTLADAGFLQTAIQEAARTYDATPEAPSAFGERYVIDFELTTDSGTATIRTAWMVRQGEDFPRLTTCYVIEDQ